MTKNGMVECSVCHSKLLSPINVYGLLGLGISLRARAAQNLGTFAEARWQRVGEKPILSVSKFVQAARNNALLAVPALLYAINNYLKFIMQWEALALLLMGISVNQLWSLPEGTTHGLPVATGAYAYTLIFNGFYCGF